VAKYSVFIKPSAVKEIEAVSRKKERQQIMQHIGQLADTPRPPGCQKLSGYDRYRIRQGSYRIVYGIEDEELVVYVVRVAHRKDVYRKAGL
jgi:mRNA interferase RelE/StbE